MLEMWKLIKEYPEYEISNEGRCRRSTDSRRRKKEERLLKPMISRKGYLVYKLSKNKKVYQRYIHSLVLATFDKPRPKGYQTNHKDGNKANNCISNLEWLTPSDNVRHAFATGLRFSLRGEKHPFAKLKECEVWLIKKILKANIISKAFIAKMFKVDESTIRSISTCSTWGGVK